MGGGGVAKDREPSDRFRGGLGTHKTVNTQRRVHPNILIEKRRGGSESTHVHHHRGVGVWTQARAFRVSKRAKLDAGLDAGPGASSVCDRNNAGLRPGPNVLHFRRCAGFDGLGGDDLSCL